MNSIVRNILAVAVGWFIGSIVNMGLIKFGHSIFPFDGIDMNNMEELAKALSTAEPKFFLFPFLAHALGTLVGAAITAAIAIHHKMKLAMLIGVLFLFGGITMTFIAPAPTWFVIVDLVLAYIPMAWLGYMIGSRFGGKN